MKPKLLVLHESKYKKPSHAESPSVRRVFDVTRSTTIKGDPDVVYCETFLKCRVELMRWGGPRMIILGGNPWHEFTLGGLGERLPTFKHLFENVTAVMCLSRFLQRQIKKHVRGKNIYALPAGLWGVDHVDNGVRPGRFRPKTSWRIDGRLTAVTSIIMNNSKIKESKWRGIPKFLKAVDPVAKKRRVKFLNSGRGKHSFRHLVTWRKKYNFFFEKNHHLDDDVDRWPGVLNAADVFVYPSTYDCWGRVVADAMCSAVPCLVFNTTSPPEVGSSLLLCDPKDPKDMARKFERLLDDEAYREKLGRAHLKEALLKTEKHRGDLALALLSTMNGKLEGFR